MTAPSDFSTEDTATTAGREIVTRRVLPTPRELVYRAFSEPERLARWWGPNGFRSTFAEFDLRPGGHWRFTMHAPDGTDYPNDSVFREVVPARRVVFHHLGPVHEFLMTQTYADSGDGTELTWQMLFTSEAHCAEVRDFVAAANEQNFDRLAAELARMQPNSTNSAMIQTNLTVQPYLHFEGRCEEAVKFYESVLGAEVTMMMRFKDHPDAAMCAGAPPEKIMHGELRIGRSTIFVSDGRCAEPVPFEGFSLSLALAETAEAERIFQALQEGGEAMVPLAPSFFAKAFGMVRDRFGLSWMLIVRE